MGETIPPATRFIDLPTPFSMKRGGKLMGGRVAYECWGRKNSSGNNVILLLTGFSPSAHAAAGPKDTSPGWWEQMLGPGKPIDTDVWHVVCVNSLGSCNGSSGPASVNPKDGTPYRLDFPDLSIEDIADSAAFAVRSLGIDHVTCVIGASMGGMTALSLVARHPSLATNLINISSAVHALPFALAIRSLQREAIRLDPQWAGGRYQGALYPASGMATARKLGLITYRSGLEWDGRFGRIRLEPNQRQDSCPFAPEFQVEGYLEANAHRFARAYDPNCYLYLSRAIDWFDLGDEHADNADAVLAGLALEKALTIGVRSDILFPIDQQLQIAEGLAAGGVRSKFIALDSPQGHDAFLVDFARFGPVVAEFLSGLAEQSIPLPHRDLTIAPLFCESLAASSAGQPAHSLVH
jgi:homoserine O-acetyltransferase